MTELAHLRAPAAQARLERAQRLRHRHAGGVRAQVYIDENTLRRQDSDLIRVSAAWGNVRVIVEVLGPWSGAEPSVDFRTGPIHPIDAYARLQLRDLAEDSHAATQIAVAVASEILTGEAP